MTIQSKIKKLNNQTKGALKMLNSKLLHIAKSQNVNSDFINNTNSYYFVSYNRNGGKTRFYSVGKDFKSVTIYLTAKQAKDLFLI